MDRIKANDQSYNVTGSRYIEYIYDAGGSVLRKIAYDSSAGTTQTDYVGGFVYVNGALSYFATAEGRVLYSGTSFTNEFTITDQQGNARVSFNNTGPSGAAKVVLENSYYGFGMVMPNSPVTGGSNKNLYNGGNEWQNDYSNLPDYYQTFYRNYDAAIGRFVGVDPMPESAESMSNYQYAGNNPVMFNDPMGNAKAAPAPQNGNPWEAQAAADNYAALMNVPYGPAQQMAAYDATMDGEFAANMFSTWNGWDMGGRGAESNGINLYHYVKGVANDPLLNAILNGEGLIANISESGAWSISYNNAEADNNGDIRGGAGMLAWGVGNTQGGSIATPLSKPANQGGGVTTDQVLFNFGLTASTVETFSGISRIGSNLQIYSATARGGVFMGNQAVKTLGIAKAAKVLGIAGAAVGEGLDIYGYFAGTVPLDKLAMDSFMAGIGLTGFGTLPAIVYFGVDAYYPGGFPAAVKNATPVYNQLNQPSAAPVQVLMGMP